MFNFFDAEFAPSVLASEASGSLPGPEFEIFTPGYVSSYVNLMASVIESGVSDANCGTLDFEVGMSVKTTLNGNSRSRCPQGRFHWSEGLTVEDTLQELDLLLTGGRLGSVAKETVRHAYDHAEAGQQLQAAQLAIAMTTEFNTLGAPLPDGIREQEEEEEITSSRSYKAAVLLFLFGGADTFNMIVPQNCDAYDDYMDIRSDLALTPDEVLEITTNGQNCSTFGLHASFDFLNTLYGKGQAAFVSNIGNLVEPTSLTTWKSKQAQRCYNLFSHADQQNGAQTLQCQESGIVAKGFGGRVADALAADDEQFRVTSFSIGGMEVWAEGVSTDTTVVEADGETTFLRYEVWRETISNITGVLHHNVYADAYATKFLSVVESVQALSNMLTSSTVDYDTSSSTLQEKFYQVARIISVREKRGAERDFFLVKMGGWDDHKNMKEKTATRFAEVDTALLGFVEELEKQEVWEQVVLSSASEFARTLDSNGGGSDHAWAGNHFIISGALLGGRIFNTFPDVASGGANDLGRGRLVPDYPWESLAVPVAKWLGVQTDDLDTVFPNLHSFGASQIIDVDELFQS